MNKSFIVLQTAAFLYVVVAAKARIIAVKNDCDITIWYMFTAGDSLPDYPTGWEAAAGTFVNFTVPDNWTAGRIWGRTECDFSGSDGATACVTGSCNGGLECATSGGTGVPPATVAEWTLSGDGNADWYDVSLVDGFNLPMEITNSASCNIASCPVDLNADCPSELVGPSGSNGAIAGCKSACTAGLGGDISDSSACCTGSHDTAETCPSSGVPEYEFFKNNCPDAYAYAYDEDSGTALFTCDTSLSADYTLTFCP
ncbi:hypothetical protein GYMLUDRAFT_98652 [Collybiopsis luxurians FD-317 M1]|uniref:Thaumatin-like protein n=1 Tax=Collybiopsis luxurians FD-317 M1 TaxID=944289 RepID=A0A0D0CQA4_9AGAR|nr:hypothetical protein GYMLUDRAFT_98652 [Collybiopsis luxurians FD-317 M1]